jgi:hypothetical protein
MLDSTPFLNLKGNIPSTWKTWAEAKGQRKEASGMCKEQYSSVWLLEHRASGRKC